MATAAAVVLFIGVTAYAIFGGADFGAGFWDLIAGGAKRGERPREIIDHSIAPVWEANHVWLIFIFVVLWTCFPEAYESIWLTLFVPLTLAALGIVLRGASFAFRKSVFRTRDRRNFGAAFAISSVLVPYFLGSVAGAIASGRVPAGGQAGDPWSSWVNPTSILGGVLAVTVVAFLAAVYLVWDARRLGDDHMVAYFRDRAVIAAVAAGVVAFVGIFVLAGRRRVPVRRPEVARPAGSDPVGSLWHGRARAPDTPRRARRPSPGDRGGGVGCHRLGCRPVGLHVADDLDRRPGRRAVRHDHGSARGVRTRGGPHPPRDRASVHARPEDAPTGGERT